MTKMAGSGSTSQRHGSADPDPDPDPHQSIRDPQHCFDHKKFQLKNSMENLNLRKEHDARKLEVSQRARLARYRTYFIKSQE
jgi:hypothetical protein